MIDLVLMDVQEESKAKFERGRKSFVRLGEKCVNSEVVLSQNENKERRTSDASTILRYRQGREKSRSRRYDYCVCDSLYSQNTFCIAYLESTG